jgi:hypothetical protein
MTTVDVSSMVSEFGHKLSISSILTLKLHTVGTEHHDIYGVHLNVVLNANIYKRQP